MTPDAKPEVDDDYDPVPEHMRAAWDELHNALCGGGGLTEARAKELNQVFLDELERTQSPEEMAAIRQAAASMPETTPEDHEGPLYFQGRCPDCELSGRDSSHMLLNYGDFWECSACKLQAHTATPGMFALMRHRGKGDFGSPKVSAVSRAFAWMLTKAGKDVWYHADPGGFNGSEELRLFLKTEVS
jgi:hypothetical protein